VKAPVKRRFGRRAPVFWHVLGVFACATLLLLGGLRQAGADDLLVAVVSDLNGSYGSVRYESNVDRAVERILALRPDLVISTGDMVAGQRRPHLSRGEVEAMWRSFHAHVSDPLRAAGIPLAVTPGNHDASAYGGFESERRIYGEQWGARKPRLRFLDDAHYPFYYAFAAGDALFISLDATRVGHLPPEQLGWLRDLLARRGGDYAQRVVFSHVPLWPFAEGRERDFIGDPALERVLRQGGVDLYLSGHHHAFYPGHREGVHYVSQSCLGAGPRRLIGAGDRSPQGFTLLQLDGQGLRIAALQSPDFRRPIDWDGLPERIGAGPAELIRADLVDGDLDGLVLESGHPGSVRRDAGPESTLRDR
jgi:3',5'-cyclic AMP phosphodiesterase CpdA